MTGTPGLVSATVVDVLDPEGMGRVEVEYTWQEGQNRGWAHVATLMAGPGRGSWIMPVVGDEVLIGFYQNQTNFPYVLGFVWNGKQKPPSDDPQRRLIQSVNEHQFEMYDPDIQDGDKGYIRLKDGHGNEVELSNGGILIRTQGTVSIEASHVFINGRRVMISPGVI